jgi:hypothetical protein
VAKPARVKLMQRDLELEQIPADSRKQAAVVLEVLAGLRTPEQAAEALGLSLQTYYNLETRALRGLIHGCTPMPPGRTMMLLKQVRSLEAKSAGLQKQVGRYQALLRNAQRSAGLLAAPPASTAGKSSTTASGRRKRPPTVRALRAVEALQRDRPPAPPIPASLRETQAPVESAAPLPGG